MNKSLRVLISPSLRLSLAVMFVAAFSGASFGAEKHVFGLDDFSALRDASAVAVSPDGKTVLYRLDYNGERGPVKHEWYLIGVNGENRRKLEIPETFTPFHFTADGSLYGAYEVEKRAQLAIVPLASEKATQIVALPRGINTAVLSPDGSKFALLADPRPKDELAETRHIIENGESSVYVVPANGGGGGWWCTALKEATDLAWSSDSTRLAVPSAFPKIGHHDLRSQIDICSASGAQRIADIPNATSGLAWSADGRELVFASTTTDTLTPDHLWTVPVSGGTPVDRTPKFEGSITNVRGDAHGRVYAELHRGVVTEIAPYIDGTLQTAYRYPNGTINDFPAHSQLANSPDVLAFSVADPSHASNVALFDGQWKKLTNEGDDLLAKVKLGDVRIVNWAAKDGTKLQAIVTFPADYLYQSGQKRPFLVLPHGGPEGNDVFQFDPFARFIAGLGYVVLQPEYRGSTGYGSDFMQAIYQHFGDRAYSDVDSATDFAVSQGWADPNRLAIFGWSAGGFMTSWTVTQTHRYKAAIEGAGITDWLSFVPASDIAQVDYDIRWQEKDPEPFLKFSAVMHADAVTTPLLILHGEADLRVPTFQGREFFVLLAERGKTVKMVTYPGSPHFPELAEQRRDILQQLKDWLAKYNP